MRLIVTLAAIALGTTSALAQMGPGSPFRPPMDQERSAPELGRREGGAPRFERVQRRERDFEDRRDFRRDGREWDRRGGDRRDRDWDRRGRYRGPVITFGAPGYFVRTLPEVVRVVRYGGRPCRVTITRRVTYRGDIVETQRRRCPGRPDVVIRRR